MSRFANLACGAAALALSLFTGRAAAHDHWIEVEPFFSLVPGRAKVYLQAGEAFKEPQPVRVRKKERFSKFQIASLSGKRDVTADVREDVESIAVLASGPRSQGSFVLALDAAPRTIQIAPKAFQAYLLDERLIDVLMWRSGKAQEDAPGRERYTRHLKAIVQVGPKLDATATQPVGQDLEIVPETHPYALGANSTLTVQILFRGRPLAGRAVAAVNRFRGDISEKTVRTDPSGKASFIVPRPGDWMIRLVHMEPVQEPDVDFRSYWASLTFSLPEPAAQGGR